MEDQVTFPSPIAMERIVDNGGKGKRKLMDEDTSDSEFGGKGKRKLMDEDTSDSEFDAEFFYESEYGSDEDDLCFGKNVDKDIGFDGPNQGAIAKAKRMARRRGKAIDRSFTEDAKGVNNDIGYDFEDGLRERIDEDEEDSDTLWDNRPEFNPHLDMEEVKFNIGMKFLDHKVLKEAIRKHAIDEGRAISFTRRAKLRVRAQCKSPCPWVIYASKHQHETYLVVKKYNPKHTCVRQFSNPLITSAWLSKQFVEDVKSNPKVTASSLKQKISDQEKVNVSIAKVYRAKRKAKDMIDNSVGDEYSDLHEYAHGLVKQKPEDGNVDLDKHRFERRLNQRRRKEDERGNTSRPKNIKVLGDGTQVFRGQTSLTCGICGNIGHNKRGCPQTSQVALSSHASQASRIAPQKDAVVEVAIDVNDTDQSSHADMNDVDATVCAVDVNHEASVNDANEDLELINSCDIGVTNYLNEQGTQSVGSGVDEGPQQKRIGKLQPRKENMVHSTRLKSFVVNAARVKKEKGMGNPKKKQQLNEKVVDLSIDNNEDLTVDDSCGEEGDSDFDEEIDQVPQPPKRYCLRTTTVLNRMRSNTKKLPPTSNSCPILLDGSIEKLGE